MRHLRGVSRTSGQSRHYLSRSLEPKVGDVLVVVTRDIRHVMHGGCGCGQDRRARQSPAAPAAAHGARLAARGHGEGTPALRR